MRRPPQPTPQVLPCLCFQARLISSVLGHQHFRLRGDNTGIRDVARQVACKPPAYGRECIARASGRHAFGPARTSLKRRHPRLAMNVSLQGSNMQDRQSWRVELAEDSEIPSTESSTACSPHFRFARLRRPFAAEVAGNLRQLGFRPSCERCHVQAPAWVAWVAIGVRPRQTTEARERDRLTPMAQFDGATKCADICAAIPCSHRVGPPS